ncbi:MAG: transglycosylase SLT domain-containing protein [Desulfocapsaceae bacterium]|nr:transglycosylase SLT domain-containing protein [Desulfocapsaceae bacterium]
MDALRRTGVWENGRQLLSDANGYTVHSDFPLTMNRQVQMYIDFFQNEQRKVFASWLSRSKRYLPMMQRELKSAGLPLDLAYLAMIESGYNQRACSSAQAIGLWQFMSETGRQYDLRIDGYVDERRDAEKSTKAAVTMLGDLYRQFGDWNLAVASYNAGAGKIGTGLKKYNVNNFWDLASKQYLSLETIRYVPQLMAAIIIAKDPARYGFTDIQYTALPSYDTVEVGPGLGFEGLALVTNSSKEELQALNPELIASKTPLDRKYQVKIPAGTRSITLNNLPRLRTVVSTEYKTHIAARKETLATISRKYNVPEVALIKANHLKKQHLATGQRVQIPVYVSRYQLARDKNEVIAQTTPLPAVKEQVVQRKDEKPAVVSVPRQAKGAVLAKGAESRVESSINVAAQKKVPARIIRDEFKWYKIADGDTLWTISQKFKTSPDEIKGWNNMKSNAIYPGDKLRVKEPNSIVAERNGNKVL